MESVLLGLVVTLCIYILYCIFTPAKEGFTNLTQSEENRLGAVASTINSPTNWDRAGTNPTNLIATAANPDSYGINQNTYNTALGNPNTGPRIDDTTSLLYMIDFCHQGAKLANPFSDSKFATSCGVCMTQGTLINGTAGSNLGVVVYPEDKAYSIAQGIDAVPSARSATCAPIVKSATASSNVRSVAINADQYTTTKAYMLSNSYTIISGTGAGTKTFRCAGSSNGHNYVIKKGAYRDGLWDTHIAGSPVDYSRKNLLTTIPFDQSCTEKNSCTLNTSSVQWDASSLCGYPKPTPITTLGLDDTKTTPTSLTFIWTGGEYAESVTYSLVKDSDKSTIPGNKATLNLTGKFVTYTGLRPNTVYTFTLIVSNPAGRAEGSFSGSASGFTNFEGFTAVTGKIQGETGDDRDKVAGLAISNIGQTNFTATWTGGQNALTITLTLYDSGNTVIQTIDKAPGSTVCQFTNLVASTTYRVMLLATYADGPSISITATAETAPVPRVPMSGVSFSGVTPTGFTVSWSGCDNASGITLLLSGPGSPANQMLSGTTKSYTYTGLQAGSMYSLSTRVTYPSGAPLTFGPYTQKTSDAPPPPPPPPVQTATPPPATATPPPAAPDILSAKQPKNVYTELGRNIPSENRVWGAPYIYDSQETLNSYSYLICDLFDPNYHSIVFIYSNKKEPTVPIFGENVFVNEMVNSGDINPGRRPVKEIPPARNFFPLNNLKNPKFNFVAPLLIREFALYKDGVLKFPNITIPESTFVPIKR